MTYFSSLKKQNCLLPENQNMQLQSSQETSREYSNLNNSGSYNVERSENNISTYTNKLGDSNILANSVKQKFANVKTGINNFGVQRPITQHSSESSLCGRESTEKSLKCKHDGNTLTEYFKQSIKQSLNIETNNETKGKCSSDTFARETLINQVKETVKGSDVQREEGAVHNISPLKRTDNIQQNQVKTKLRSMWNNMKYGWRVKREVNLKVDSAAWLLGHCYHNKLNESSSLSQDKQLKLDLFSKIWLTYRINFPTIPGTDFVSDSGWGCMLRCGQMMMAQALVCHFLHREWRISYPQSDEMKHLYKMILRWFGDSLLDSSPFSLHHLVSLGNNYGRKAGDWYGPTHVAQVLRDALCLAVKKHPELKNIRMHVALDGIVFKQDIEDLCRSSKKPENVQYNDSDKRSNCVQENNLLHETNNFNEVIDECMHSYVDPCPSYSEYGPPSFNTSQKCWKSLILFVSVRLGNDKINPFYIPSLKSLLAYEHCIGIIGGRPKHALYFIGWQDDKLIHLDPHSCQPAVDMETEDFNGKSFHSSSIRTISFTEMDPSCAIGFYFKMEEEFKLFVEKFSEIIAPMKRNLDYPIFALAEGRRTDVEEIDSYSSCLRSSFSNQNIFYKDEDDDYILL